MGESAGRFFLSQLLETVGCLHSQGVVHRDLKLDNMLLDDEMNIKILDFGFSHHGDASSLSSNVGTDSYMAPELLRRQRYDGKATDVFALGVILFILVVGNTPFRKAVDSDPYFKLL